MVLERNQQTLRSILLVFINIFKLEQVLDTQRI